MHVNDIQNVKDVVELCLRTTRALLTSNWSIAYEQLEHCLRTTGAMLTNDWSNAYEQLEHCF